MSKPRAIYSYADDAFQLYISERLDSDIYSRLKCAGFKWLEREWMYVAWCWTPSRYDLLQEICGEVEENNISSTEKSLDRLMHETLRIEEELRRTERDLSVLQSQLEFWLRDDITREEALLITSENEYYGDFCMPRKDTDEIACWPFQSTAFSCLSGRHPDLFEPRTLQEVIDEARIAVPKRIQYHTRYLEHYNKRLAYAKAEPTTSKAPSAR